jgi:hypothetical protein
MAQDVFKILKDLELKTVGLDPKTNKMQEGYFVSFRTVGLPIHGDDFANPWTPLGGNLEKDLEKDIPKSDPVDPKDAKKTAREALHRWCAERLAESGHDNRVQRMEVE